MDKLKIIKSVVFILTFLLIFGTMLLLGNIIKQIKNSSPTISEEINLNEPENSEIKTIASDSNYMYILINGGNKSDRIIIFDANKGEIISKININ